MPKRVFWFIAVVFVFFNMISSESFSGTKCLSKKFHSRKHDDYKIPLLRRIPWKFTSWCFVQPPIPVLGNQKRIYMNNRKTMKPIPEHGTWQFSLVQIKRRVPFFIPYFAVTMPKGTHFSIGCRWDDVDNYYVFPRVALKKIKSPK